MTWNETENLRPNDTTLSLCVRWSIVHFTPVLFGGGGVKHKSIVVKQTVGKASVDCALPTVLYSPPPTKWTRGKVADFEQNFEHSALGFASQRSFLRKTKQYYINER